MGGNSHEHCKLGGALNSVPYLEKNMFQLLRCSSCSVVYLKVDPSIRDLTEFYSADYFQSGPDGRGYESYQDWEPYLKMNFKRRIRKLARYVPNGRVLDVGCSYGFYLRWLEKNYEGHGIDISEHAIGIARDKYGLNVKDGILKKDTFPINHFSLISMWDVVEHLSDQKVTLEILHTILRDDGVIALIT